MTAELAIPSDLAGARRVQDLVENALRAAAHTDHAVFSIKLAVEEALVEAIKHGNRMDPDKSLRIVCDVTAERFAVLVTDEHGGIRSVIGRRS